MIEIKDNTITYTKLDALRFTAQMNSHMGRIFREINDLLFQAMMEDEEIDSRIREAFPHILSLMGLTDGLLKAKAITLVLSGHRDYGELISISDFKDSCERGGFVDYDGFGYYSTEQYESAIKVYPSTFLKYGPIDGFTHVKWYNR